MWSWLYSGSVVWWLSFGSIAAFAGSLIAIPWILVRLPPHYFDERQPRIWLKGRHPALRCLAIGLINVLGVLFILAGIAMLVLPGQGMLTMLVGLSLVEFPGKRALERKIISIPLVYQTINGLRARFDRPSLVIYPHCDLAEAPTVPGNTLPPKDKSLGA
jgi:Putative transmembrane protein (PGPGW)